jgi:citronellol/citronellal dehydrogenase
MAMAEEFRGDGIAFNTLWPRTIIATAAVRNLLGGDAAIGRSRLPAIVADAAHVILTSNSREFTGRHCIDEDVLLAAGVTDLEVYRSVPGSGALAPDLFVAAEPPAA